MTRSSGPSAPRPALACVGAALAAILLLAATDLAAAKSKKNDKSDSDSDADAVCSMDTGGTGSASKPLNANEGLDALRYLIGGVCVEVSGNVQATGQYTRAPEPRLGPKPTQPATGTINPDFRVETSRSTAHGAFKTAFEIDWKYATDSGPDDVPTLDEASIAYLGVTVGYADSLMNFWDSGSLQFGASAPNRSSYLVSYKHSITDALTLAAAVEAGSPTSRGATTWQLPNTPPYFTAQLNYDKDDWGFQIAAATHEVDVEPTRRLGGSSASRQGWAATTGITIPFKSIAEDDAFSAQVSYAVDSAIFLGTQQDVAFLANQFPVSGPTRGWSAVGSYVHNWSDKWASTIFASYLTLDVDLVLTQSRAKVMRTGVNLTWQPIDDWTLGVELDVIDARIDLLGPLGRMPSASIKGPTAYVWLTRDF
jgi:hypothetical protein